MKRAAYAAERFFNFKTIFPCHYKTFPLLEQNADLLRDSLPNVEIIEADVLKEYIL
jgi:L-ascorbate metabolism protein UlaG (beta-lactamase superfamily)